MIGLCIKLKLSWPNSLSRFQPHHLTPQPPCKGTAGFVVCQKYNNSVVVDDLKLLAADRCVLTAATGQQIVVLFTMVVVVASTAIDRIGTCL